MRNTLQQAPAAHSLNATLVSVRRRWRVKNVAVGAAVCIAVVALSMWATAAIMESLRFSSESVIWSRVGVGLLTLAAVSRWLLYPLLRRVPDERLALYLEERVPALDGAVISAVEMQRSPAQDEGRSALLVRGLMADAVRRLQRSGEVLVLERPATLRALAVAAVLAAASASLFIAGPGYLRQAARLIFTPWSDPALAPVYAIATEPGDVTVARGSDVQINARLQGFQTELVEVLVRRGTAGEWERIPMGPATDSARFVARLFDVDENTEYFVEANGIQSAPALLTVRDLPAVSTMSVASRGRC